jgi:hypothetical protein
MTILRRLLSAFALWALAMVCVPAPAGAAVQDVPCARPFVFPGAAVNVVVLPYTVPPGLPRVSTDTGRKLAALVQLEALLSIAKYGSAGAVQLVGTPEEGCTPEVVLRKLLGLQGGARQELRPGGALVLVWGRVYQSGEDIYLQSYVQFLRRDTPETVEVRLGESAFRGRVSSQAFACAPRRMAVADLTRVEEQYLKVRRVHDEPDESSRATPVSSDRPFGYWITSIRGEWMEIVPFPASGGGAVPNAESNIKRGWVRARADNPDFSLRRLMPELGFIEGAGAYLRWRVQAAGTNGAPDLALTLGDRAIRGYIDDWAKGAVMPSAAESGTSLAISAPLQLRAMIALLRREASADDLRDARTALQRALRLTPHSADARNLDVLLQLRLAFSGGDPDADPLSLADKLVDALGADPENADVVANLAAVYDLALAPSPNAPSKWKGLSESARATIQQRREEVGPLLARRGAAERNR